MMPTKPESQTSRQRCWHAWHEHKQQFLWYLELFLHSSVVGRIRMGWVRQSHIVEDFRGALRKHCFAAPGHWQHCKLIRGVPTLWVIGRGLSPFWSLEVVLDNPSITALLGSVSCKIDERLHRQNTQTSLVLEWILGNVNTNPQRIESWPNSYHSTRPYNCYLCREHVFSSILDECEIVHILRSREVRSRCHHLCRYKKCKLFLSLRRVLVQLIPGRFYAHCFHLWWWRSRGCLTNLSGKLQLFPTRLEDFDLHIAFLGQRESYSLVHPQSIWCSGLKTWSWSRILWCNRNCSSIWFRNSTLFYWGNFPDTNSHSKSNCHRCRPFHWVW